MSLTSQLADKASVMSRVIEAVAPDLALAGTRGAVGVEMAEEFGFNELLRLPKLITIEGEHDKRSHATVAGMAVDTGFRMSLPGFFDQKHAAYKGLEILETRVDSIPSGKKILKNLTEALGLIDLSLQRGSGEVMNIARYAVVYSWAEAIYRSGPIVALDNKIGRKLARAKDGADTAFLPDEKIVIDVSRMLTGLADFIAAFMTSISGGERVVMNPEFSGAWLVGGADGDLLHGDTLVDIKSTEKISSSWLRATLQQLLAYTLLDFDDEYGIRNVVVLLPRQHHGAKWSISDLLGIEAEEALPHIRRQLKELLLEGE